MLKIKSYISNTHDELLKFLSNDDFMDTSSSPRDSVIASILDYQQKTDNYGRQLGSVLTNENNNIVGFLGCLAFPAKYKNQELLAVQTTSAFVDKNYPGNFRKMIAHYVDENKDKVIFTNFPTPKIFSSFEKCGFVEVNVERFKAQYYLVVKPHSFSKDLLRHKKLLQRFSNLFALIVPKNNLNRNKFKTYSCEIMTDFNNDYSLIEDVYNRRMSDYFVSAWSRSVLNNKFGNKVSLLKDNIRENEILHIATFNFNRKIVGSIVIKKVRNYKRFIISDIQTVEVNRDEIINSLIYSTLKTINQIGYNSLMFFGIEEIYSNIILQNFKSIKKAIDKRVYYKPNGIIPPDKINFVFSDDDLNF
ncbi:MAG: hypothetical protein A2W98_04870 [Bacteroidetes bacterium GWF2_33_38]|nr:MAG: hypothetical protein A2W98_04870 [Bacteroidetes bacterium GWF2_33_38]OFY76141.1 MAG: hypothetical protein A2265_07665 [Bacteroidetes bacterium RIFOXYA12_FULL_33_9]OFY90737.1 MAG: hypothetical protein A2236_05520 [Bacteroidetes bacterium RIFOXYA2_FULL_33_7]